MTVSYTFDPPLSSLRSVCPNPSSIENGRIKIFFTAFPDQPQPQAWGQDEGEADKRRKFGRPEVWTNLTDDGSWRGVPFEYGGGVKGAGVELVRIEPSGSDGTPCRTTSPSQDRQDLLVAEVSIPVQNFPRSYEWTYRIVHGEGEGAGVQWVGGYGSNGRLCVWPSSGGKGHEIGGEGDAGRNRSLVVPPEGTLRGILHNYNFICDISNPQSVPVSPSEAHTVGKGVGGGGGKVETRLVEYRLRREGSVTSSSSVWVKPSGTSSGAWEKGWYWRGQSGATLLFSPPTWYTPRHIPNLSSLSQTYDSQLLILRPTGQELPSHHHDHASHFNYRADDVIVVFPFSTFESAASIRGGLNGDVVLRSEREEWEIEGIVDGCVGVARGKIWEVEMAYRGGGGKGKVRGGGRSDSDGEEGGEGLEGLEQPQSLRYCTWNSLQNPTLGQFKVSDVLKALEGQKKAGISDRIDTLLIDDGWQNIRYLENGERRLAGFGCIDGWLDVDGDGNEVGGRADGNKRDGEAKDDDDGGLKDLEVAVRVIKKMNPNIRRVGVWLTLEGYWNALDESPSSYIGKSFKIREYPLGREFVYPPERSGGWYLPEVEDVGRFWDEYFGGLRRAGVDFVKVDNQAHYDWLISEPDGKVAAVRREMHRCMKQAGDKWFGDGEGEGSVIHCMNHSPRFWGGLVGIGEAGRKSKVIMRNSDDFFPDVVDSHRWHIVVNSANSLLTRSLNVHPDLDMMQSKHPFASYHAAFRTFSTAPTYITDSPNEHNPDVLKHLVARTKSGKYGVVKTRVEQGAKIANRAIDMEVGDDVGKAVKIGLSLPGVGGGGGVVGGILGLWNCRGQNRNSRDVVTARDVAELLPSGHTSPVALYFFSTGSSVVIESFDADEEKQTSAVSSRPLAGVDIPTRGFEMVTISPFSSFLTVGGQSSGFQIAPLGLVDKFAGLSALAVVTTATWQSGSPPPQYGSLGIDIGREQIQSTLVTSPPTKTASSNASPSRQTQIPVKDDIRSYGPSNDVHPPPPSSPRSRAQYLVEYVQGHRSPEAAEVRSEIDSLRRDLVNRPVRTIWHETKSVFRIVWTFVWIAVGELWRRVFNRGDLTGGGDSGPVMAEDDERRPLLAAPTHYQNRTTAAGSDVGKADIEHVESVQQASFGSTVASPVRRTEQPIPLPTPDSRTVLRVESVFADKLGFLIYSPSSRSPDISKIHVGIHGQRVPSSLVQLQKQDAKKSLLLVRMDHFLDQFPLKDSHKWAKTEKDSENFIVEISLDN